MAKNDIQIQDKTAAIIHPRVTEKAALMAEKGIYTFMVRKGATSGDIAHAVTLLYKVTPLDVRVVKIPSKTKFSRGKFGVKKGGVKAYVQLKKGDSIDFA